MKPPPFDYRRAGSVDEAVALLAEHGDEAKVLAGGQSLIPLLNRRLIHPTRIIDINRANGLDTVTVGEDLTLGPVVRHRTIERSEVVRSANPLLADAARFIGHIAIRTRGTIGGSIANADPFTEFPTVLTALDGQVEARSTRGTRTIPASALFTGFLTSSLEPDELITAVRMPRLPPGSGWSWQEFSRQDRAIVGVAAVLRLDGDRIVAARLAFSGVDSIPVRARNTEAALAGASPSPRLWASAAREAAATLEPTGSLQGSAAYHKHLAAVLAERALTTAHSRVQEN